MGRPITQQDEQFIKQIAHRYMGIDELDSEARVAARIRACHRNACALHLDLLARADDFNFAHDVRGILSKLSRNGRCFADHFRPRFALYTKEGT